MRRTVVSGLLTVLLGFSTAPAFAEGRLTLYCSSDAAWCQQAKTEFEKKTGISVDMTRKSSGETYAQIKAESANPKGDIWWGGTGDPHLQAAEEGLTEAYVSPLRGELQDWANRQAAASKVRTVGIYSGALGFGYNEVLLKKQGLPVPACWKDLIKPVYKGKVQVANPNSS
ncbi:MAG: extracellular solute-binding protein, partial [Burkholderiaceae bacterium]